MITKIILASNNPHKQEKMRWIVEGVFSEIKKPNYEIEVEEDGMSFEENAKIKAIAVAKKEGCYAIATDGGVMIPSLGSNWDPLFTKRFINKKDANDFDRIDAFLELMKEKEGEERRFVFGEAIAIASPDKVMFSTEVEGDTGLIQKTYNPKQYKEGVWLCTLCSYPQFDNKNFFELTEKQKEYGEISWWKLREETRKFLLNYGSQ